VQTSITRWPPQPPRRRSDAKHKPIERGRLLLALAGTLRKNAKVLGALEVAQAGEADFMGPRLIRSRGKNGRWWPRRKPLRSRLVRLHWAPSRRHSMGVKARMAGCRPPSATSMPQFWPRTSYLESAIAGEPRRGPNNTAGANLCLQPGLGNRFGAKPTLAQFVGPAKECRDVGAPADSRDPRRSGVDPSISDAAFRRGPKIVGDNAIANSVIGSPTLLQRRLTEAVCQAR
jgi:hypothetical protein